jgi:hypothetical protein
MPISPENKDRYPANWEEISNYIRFYRAGGRCECTGDCGVRHEDQNEERHARCHKRHGTDLTNRRQVILTVAHLCQDPSCIDESHMKAMCQGCHLRYDARQHVQTGHRHRRERKEAGGQLTMFD